MKSTFTSQWESHWTYFHPLHVIQRLHQQQKKEEHKKLATIPSAKLKGLMNTQELPICKKLEPKLKP